MSMHSSPAMWAPKATSPALLIHGISAKSKRPPPGARSPGLTTLTMRPPARRAEDTRPACAIAAALSGGHDPGECEVPYVVEARVEERAQELPATRCGGDIRHHHRGQPAGACRIPIDAGVHPQRLREGLE